MEITGNITLRFKKVGDKLLWNGSIPCKQKDTYIWCNAPVTLSKEVEESVKKMFKGKKFKTDDKFVKVYVKKGFISAYKDKENKSVLKLVLMEVSEPTTKETDEVKDEEIPF